MCPEFSLLSPFSLLVLWTKPPSFSFECLQQHLTSFPASILALPLEIYTQHRMILLEVRFLASLLKTLQRLVKLSRMRFLLAVTFPLFPHPLQPHLLPCWSSRWQTHCCRVLFYWPFLQPGGSSNSDIYVASFLTSFKTMLKSHFLIRVYCACMLSRLSLVRLFETLWTLACQALLSMGFSRQEYWSGFPCPPPGDLPNPGIEPVSVMSSALAGRFFTTQRALLKGVGMIRSEFEKNPLTTIWTTNWRE